MGTDKARLHTCIRYKNGLCADDEHQCMHVYIYIYIYIYVYITNIYYKYIFIYTFFLYIYIYLLFVLMMNTNVCMYIYIINMYYKYIFIINTKTEARAYPARAFCSKTTQTCHKSRKRAHIHVTYTHARAHTHAQMYMYTRQTCMFFYTQNMYLYTHTCTYITCRSGFNNRQSKQGHRQDQNHIQKAKTGRNSRLYIKTKSSRCRRGGIRRRVCVYMYAH
jgi:hypothetical protein